MKENEDHLITSLSKIIKLFNSLGYPKIKILISF